MQVKIALDWGSCCEEQFCSEPGVSLPNSFNRTRLKRIR